MCYRFDSRVINIGQRNGWFTVANSIKSTRDITTFSINFYLNCTYAPIPFGSAFRPTLTQVPFRFQPGSPSAWLVWGAVPPYSAMYTTIALVDPTANIAPFYLDFSAPSAFGTAYAYTTAFNFTSDGQLKFENIPNRFYAKLLHMPFYNADAVFWLFGDGPAPAGYSPITLWRYKR